MPTNSWLGQRAGVVSSYAIDEGDHLLFDPLAVPSAIEQRAAGRETAIAHSWCKLRGIRDDQAGRFGG